MAGYSTTPLSKKLGIKEGFNLYVKNPPDNYLDLVSPLPKEVGLLQKPGKELDIAHVFVKKKTDLETSVKSLLNRIKPAGMIWVSWPKKASKVATDITEDTIREVALPLGLVDVKVCAVDEVWSGLKLVIRKENRK